MIDKYEADNLVKEGQIRVWAAFEVLSGKEEMTKKSLTEHLEKLDNLKGVKLYKKQFSDVKRVEKPLRGLEVGFSYVCESEFIVKDMEELISVVLNFGPSSLEILEPKEIKLNVSKAQAVVDLVASVMHRYAAAGLGGIVVAGAKQ
jgi:hypothetical protein